MAKRRRWMPAQVDGSTDLRLQNWGDWRRREDARRTSSCASVEGRYRPPREFGSDVESVSRSPWRPTVDVEDGALVDRVLRHPWFPVAEFAFLRAHYVLRAPPALIMRTLAARRGEFDARLARAVTIARNRLAVVDSRRAAAVMVGPARAAPTERAPDSWAAFERGAEIGNALAAAFERGAASVNACGATIRAALRGEVT